MQTNQLCLTLIELHTSFRRIDDPRLIAACHCGAEYEAEYSTSIETHTPTSIDSTNQKSIDNQLKESIDSSPVDWENDYYNPTLAVHTAKPSARATPHTESMMRIIRRNELHSIEEFVLRKIDSSTIPLE